MVKDEMKLVCIGDVHGKTHIYQKMLRQKYQGVRSVQLGDMGIGFKGVGLHEMEMNHRWFRGNHDWPEKCRANTNYLGDFGGEPDTGLFWVAGAQSIDRQFRIEGVTWWPDEEMSYDELGRVFDLYRQVKPRVMLSHETPNKAGEVLLRDLMGGYFFAKAGCIRSRTAQALQNMLDEHQPEIWCHGHYHVDKEYTVPGYATKFVCIAELGTYEVEL